MGWNISTIVVTNPPPIDMEELLTNLGFKNLIKIEDRNFDTAISPKDGQVYVGFIDNNLIVSVNTLPFDSLTNQLSETELALTKLFPKSEICTLTTVSSVNHFGYAVIKNGNKIRVKAGDFDHGTLIDYGEPLAEEQILLQQSKISDFGQRLYYLQTGQTPLEEHQVGENYIFDIFKRYSERNLDSDEVLETTFVGFDFDQNADIDYFDGDWFGAYQLTEGYSQKVTGKSTDFVITMKITNNQLKGIVTDSDKKQEKAAIINGILSSPFILFTKTYPYRPTVDKDGNSKLNKSEPSADIHYSGLYDHNTDSFRGNWHIDNSKCWGTWTMTRQ